MMFLEMTKIRFGGEQQIIWGGNSKQFHISMFDIDSRLFSPDPMMRDPAGGDWAPYAPNAS